MNGSCRARVPGVRDPGGVAVRAAAGRVRGAAVGGRLRPGHGGAHDARGPDRRGRAPPAPPQAAQGRAGRARAARQPARLHTRQ